HVRGKVVQRVRGGCRVLGEEEQLGVVHLGEPDRVAEPRRPPGRLPEDELQGHPEPADHLPQPCGLPSAVPLDVPGRAHLAQRRPLRRVPETLGGARAPGSGPSTGSAGRPGAAAQRIGAGAGCGAPGPTRTLRRRASSTATTKATRVARELTAKARNTAWCQSPRASSAAYRVPVPTARPMAAPIRCPVCITPPAAPPLATGTSARVRDWLGPMTRPWAIPTTRNAPASAHRARGPSPATSASTAVPSWPTTATTVPQATSGRPCRLTSRPPTTEATDPARAAGTVMRPATRADWPRPSWTNRART